MAEEAACRVDVEAMLARSCAGGPARALSRHQARAVALCALAALLSALSTNEYVFTTGRIQTRCHIPECENSTELSEFLPIWIGNAVPTSTIESNGFDNCQRFVNTTSSNGYNDFGDTCPATLFDNDSTVNCEQYVYENTNSVVFTLGLACDEWRRSLLGSARTFGALLSLPIAGAVSDRWGRRPALVAVMFTTACIGVLRVWASTYAGFIISVFAEASLGAGAILACCYILSVETVPIKYRLITGIMMNCFSSIGQVILGLLAWIFPNWKHLTLVIYVPQLLTISYIWILPESLRWYCSKGLYKEAEEAIRDISNVNKVKLSEKTLLELKQAADFEVSKSAKENTSDEPWLIVEVFRYKAILLRVISAPVWWITVILVFYGLSVNAVNISGNMYFNYIVVSVVAIPGFLTSLLLLDRIGRKSVIVTGFWVCAACQVAFIFIPTGQYVTSLIVYLIGKYSISMAGTAIYVYTSELYPTQYRHRLFGFTSMMGRIGSILAPLTPALGAKVWQPLPFVLFAGMALISGLLVTLLPETMGCRLPDTMQEAADLGKPKQEISRLDNSPYH